MVNDETTSFEFSKCVVEMHGTKVPSARSVVGEDYTKVHCTNWNVNILMSTVHNAWQKYKIRRCIGHSGNAVYQGPRSMVHGRNASYEAKLCIMHDGSSPYHSSRCILNGRTTSF